LLFMRENRRVRLYVQDGPTLEGVLAGRTRSDYILWAPKIITDTDLNGDPPVEMSGHVEVERKRVLYKQVIG
jgi:hypothetical protein